MKPYPPNSVAMDLGDFALLQNKNHCRQSKVLGYFPTSHDRSKGGARSDSLYEQ